MVFHYVTRPKNLSSRFDHYTYLIPLDQYSAKTTISMTVSLISAHILWYAYGGKFTS